MDKQRLPDGWHRFETEQGQPYFHNTRTNTTIWHDPSEEPAPATATSPSTAIGNNLMYAGATPYSVSKPPDGGLLHHSAMGLVHQGLGSRTPKAHSNSSTSFSPEQRQMQRAAAFASPLHMLDRWSSWGEKLTGLGEKECRSRLKTQWALMAGVCSILTGFSLFILVSTPDFEDKLRKKLYGGFVSCSTIFYIASLVTSLTLIIQMDLRSTFEHFAAFIRVYVYFFGYNTFFLFSGIFCTLLASMVLVLDFFGWEIFAAFAIIGAVSAIYVIVRTTHMNCEALLASKQNFRVLRDNQPADRKMAVDLWLQATLRPFASEENCNEYTSAFAEAGCRTIETLALLDQAYIEPILTVAHISGGRKDGVPKLHLSIIRKELAKLQNMQWLCLP